MGLGPPAWIIISLFVLLSGVIGKLALHWCWVALLIMCNLVWVCRNCQRAVSGQLNLLPQPRDRCTFQQHVYNTCSDHSQVTAEQGLRLYRVIRLQHLFDCNMLHRLGFCLVCTGSICYTAGCQHQTGVHCPPQHARRACSSPGARYLLVWL